MDFIQGEAVDFDSFLFGGFAGDQFHPGFGDAQLFGQKSDQGLIGPAVHGRGGDFYFQLIARAANQLVAGRSGDQVDLDFGPDILICFFCVRFIQALCLPFLPQGRSGAECIEVQIK
jgi:hypothetical protein